MPEGSGVETIDLNGDYPLEVLSYYIWGQKERPKGDEMVNEYYANRKYGDKNINLNFSKQQYLEKFFGIKNTDDLKALSKRFGLFNTFFNSNGKTKSGANLDFSEYEDRISNGEMVLSHSEFVKVFYKGSSSKIVGDASKAELPISFYKENTNMGEEFAKAAFVFGSTSLTFNTNIKEPRNDLKYIIKVTENPDGTKTYTPDRVENLKFSPSKDNFNFESDDIQAYFANYFLGSLTDPNGIGKVVDLTFIDGKDQTYAKEALTITKDEFNTYSKKPEESLDFDKCVQIISNYLAYFKKM